jgi:hypothetical protein
MSTSARHFETCNLNINHVITSKLQQMQSIHRLESYHEIPYMVLDSDYACDRCANCPMKFELSHELLPNLVDNNWSSHSASRPVNNDICKTWTLALKPLYMVFLGQLIIFHLFKKFLVIEPTFITQPTKDYDLWQVKPIHSFTIRIYNSNLILHLHKYKQVFLICIP